MRLFVVLIYILVATQFTQIVTAQNKSSDIPFDRAARVGVLGNGLTYYIRRTERANEGIEMRFVLKAGYSREDVNQIHYAHVLEHIAASSTRHYTDVFGFFKTQGLRPGKDFNANTSTNETVYRVKIPIQKEVLMQDCFQWFADVCSQVVLDSESIENGRSTVLSELGKPSGTGGSEYWDAGIRSVPLDKSILSVEHLDHDALIRYYNDWYRPDLASVVVTGNVDLDSVEISIRDIFERIKPRMKGTELQRRSEKFPTPVVWHVEPLSKDDIYTIEIRKFIPSFKTLRISDYKRLFFIDLFNRMASNRFSSFKDLSNGFQVNLNYHRNYAASNGELDMLICRIVLSGYITKSDVIRATKVWLELQEQVNQIGFTAPELQLIKDELMIANNTFVPKTAEDFATAFERQFVGESAAPDPIFMEKFYKDWLSKVTLPEIHKEVLQWQRKGSLENIVVKGSVKGIKLLLTEQEFMKLRADIQNVRPATFVPPVLPTTTLLTSKEVGDLKGENVLFDEEELQGFGVNILHLNNGMNIVLKPIQGDDGIPGRVFLDATRTGGLNIFEGDDVLIALTSASIIKKSGLKGLSKFETDELFLRKKLSIYPFISDTDVGFSCESKSDGIEFMLQAMREYILNPQVDKSIIEPTMRSVLEYVKEKGTVYDSLNRTYFNEFPQSSAMEILSMLPEEEDFKRIYQQLFSNVNGFEVVITGDFDMMTMKLLVLKYLGTICADNDNLEKSVVRNTFLPEEAAFEIIESNGLGDKSVNIFVYSQIDTSLQARMERSVLRTILQDVLFERLRRKMGVVYQVVVVDRQIDGNWSQFSISFRTSFGNVNTSIEAVWEEIEKLKQGNISAEMMRSALEQEIFKIHYEKSERFWSKYFLEQFRYNRPINELIYWERMLPMIKCGDLTEAVRRHFPIKSVKRIGA